MNVQRLNNLLASGKGHTVLFRLPEESLCTIVQQTDGEPAVLPSVAELGSEEGYVMTPFAPSAEHPILLLHPDILESFSLEELESTATFLNGNEGAAALDADAASAAALNGSQQKGDSPQTSQRNGHAITSTLPISMHRSKRANSTSSSSHVHRNVNIPTLPATD